LGIVGRQFGPRVPQAQASCYGIDTPMFEDPASAKFSYRTGYVGRLGRITIAPSLTDTSTVAPRRLVPRARQISEVATDRSAGTVGSAESWDNTGQQGRS
jgi:hypothetical protein